MKPFYIKLTIALLSLPILIYGSDKKQLDYEFTQDDTYYSFRGSFIAKAELDYLLNVIYSFEHISKYALGAKSIDLVRQGENWYEVTYVYRKFIFFENKSAWQRTLKRKENMIVFEMISSTNNLAIMPELLSSTGYYQLKLVKEGCRIEYFQECQLKPGFLKATYINQAKKEAIKFLHVFKEYIENICD